VDARRVESEYQFDRLADAHLVQVYDLLVPQHRKVLEKGKEHVDSLVFEHAVSEAHDGGAGEVVRYERGA